MRSTGTAARRGTSTASSTCRRAPERRRSRCRSRSARSSSTTRSGPERAPCPACRAASERCTDASAGCRGRGSSSRRSRLARSGVTMPPAHAACLAMLAPVFTMQPRRPAHLRARRGGRSRRASSSTSRGSPGARAPRRGRARTASTRLDRGVARLRRRGDRGVARRPRGLRAAVGSSRSRSPYAGRRVPHARAGSPAYPRRSQRLPALRGLDGPARVHALLAALDGPAPTGTRRTSSRPTADGNACVLTSSLGLGTGDFLPGLDLHLNSMLGEVDLVRAPLVRAGSGWRA